MQIHAWTREDPPDVDNESVLDLASSSVELGVNMLKLNRYSTILDVVLFQI